MQGWYINIWIFSPWLYITHLITENLLQYGLCHGDSKSHHNSYSLLKVLWKNFFVVVVYYELSFLVPDIMQKYECIINTLMLKLMSCNSLSYRSNWHEAFSKFKEIISEREIPYFTHLYIFPMFRSPQQQQHALHRSCQMKTGIQIEWYTVT